MQEELLIAIGRLYVEASRYQALAQQLQDTIEKQQSELVRLKQSVPSNAPTTQG